MRSLISGLTLAMLIPTVTAAQQIRGVVVEDSTFLPISGVKIELLTADTTLRAMSFSNVTGWFVMLPQTGGQFVLRASHPAYRSIDIIAVTLAQQEVITVVLRLSGGPIPLDPLVVKAAVRDRQSGFRERSRVGASGRFITRADIDKLGAYSLAHALRFTPEIRIERVRDGPFMTEGVFMRTFGDLCVPAVFLDGVAVPIGRGFDISDLLTVEAVEGIEVYRSWQSAPMEFRLPGLAENMFCGVIAVWSRPLPRAALGIKGVLLAAFLIGSSLLLGRLVR